MNHACAVTGCETPARANHYLCRWHYSLLPTDLASTLLVMSPAYPEEHHKRHVDAAIAVATAAADGDVGAALIAYLRWRAVPVRAIELCAGFNLSQFELRRLVARLDRDGLVRVPHYPCQQVELKPDKGC